jgi:hypothetical protein
MSFYSDSQPSQQNGKGVRDVFTENILFNLQLLKKDAQLFVDRINLMENLLIGVKPIGSNLSNSLFFFFFLFVT